MPKIRCDQCKTVSETNKGFCPDCGAIFVPPFAIVGDDNQVKYSTVREDLGHGKERKLLLKKQPDPNAKPQIEEDDEDVSGGELTLADLPMHETGVMPAGINAFPGFSMLMVLISILGWLTLVGAPLGAGMYRVQLGMPMTVGLAIGGFCLGLIFLVIAGAGQVLVQIEMNTRAAHPAPAPAPSPEPAPDAAPVPTTAE